uniref:G-patch domain-containing protein n=1 Tax=Anopheles coluzzii TaxID=1518534 RepID=A0A6E8VXD9_ANOCL|nr:PIN2/TERF1-interacting telomerase inhibitor 1-like isoform X1 [Anopheles coluzzii]
MGDGDFSSVTLSSAKARQKKLCTMRLNDPVKKPYYKDTDSFGARMLSKLGWTEGKGLGRDENGITIPISNRVKLDTEGVGFVGGRDDMWTQHEAGFTELLRRLNGDESEPAEGAGDAVIDPKSQVQSLEERSKQSRARVHYTRFTRGKDLSRVNEKDLANIFGKRSLTESSRPREEEEQPASSGGESAEEDRPVLGLSTIKASMSMQDYFKEKMKQRAAAGNGVAPVEATVKTNGQGGEEEMVTEETHEKIKKKKSKKKAKENEQTVEPMEEAVAVEEAPATKKSKRKREQLEENEQEVLVNGDSVEPESEPSEPVKKKKKAKKHNSEQEPTVESACEVREEMAQMVDETVAAEEPVKKKKKSKKQTFEPELKVEPFSEVTEEEKVVATVENTATVDEPVKKKKKSKKTTSDPEPPVVESTDEVAEAELEPPTDTTATVQEPMKKKKKSKTPKSESSTEEGEVETPTPEPNTVEAGQEPANTTETDASTSAKKKKKKKGNRAASPADGEAANNEPASSPAVNGGTTEPASNGKESVGPMDEITLQVAAANALSAEYAGKSEETTCKVKVEVLKYLDEARFAGSNFGDIIGYRLTEDVKLVKNAASKEGGDGGPSRKFTPRRR